MEIRPPHTENWNIISKERADANMLSNEIRDLILENSGAPFVQPSALFEGQVKLNDNGKAYVDVNDNNLRYSVGFYRFHVPLYLDYDNNENEEGNYYHTESGDFRVKYTGVGNPLNELRPDTVLRFFLSQPFDFMGREVFWLQLSGWFL